jgi:hypothetical protein
VADLTTTLQGLETELALLESLEEIAAALEEFGSTLSTYQGANAEEHLTDDSSLQWLLGKLKDPLTKLESIEEAHETLTKGAGAASDFAGHFSTVQSMVDVIAKAETASGAEQADALKSIVDGMPGLATALLGLGELNPVIGTFLVLYGKAIESAAVVIGQVEARHAEQMEIIDSRGEVDVEALLAQREAAAESAAYARQQLRDEYHRVLDAWIARTAAEDRSRYKVVARFCARKNADAVRNALLHASGIPVTIKGRDLSIVGKTDVDESDLADLDAWLEGVDGIIAQEMATATDGGPGSANAVQRAKELTDRKAQVQDSLKDVKKCITKRWEWELTHGAGSGRRRLLIGGGGAFAGLALIGALIVLPLDSPEPSPTTTTVSSPTTASEVAAPPDLTSPTTIPEATTEPLSSCELAKRDAEVLEVSSPEFGATHPSTYTRSEAYESGFATPPLEWGVLPDATTEVAIVMLLVPDSQAADYTGAEDPFAISGGASHRWIAAGLDPADVPNGIGSTSLSTPISNYSSGAVELDHGAVGVEVDGEPASNKFVGGSTDDLLLVGVFALCDPDTGARDNYRASWLAANAVTYGWAFAAAP